MIKYHQENLFLEFLKIFVEWMTTLLQITVAIESIIPGADTVTVLYAGTYVRTYKYEVNLRTVNIAVRKHTYVMSA